MCAPEMVNVETTRNILFFSYSCYIHICSTIILQQCVILPSHRGKFYILLLLRNSNFFVKYNIAKFCLAVGKIFRELIASQSQSSSICFMSNYYIDTIISNCVLVQFWLPWLMLQVFKEKEYRFTHFISPYFNSIFIILRVFSYTCFHMIILNLLVFTLILVKKTETNLL